MTLRRLRRDGDGGVLVEAALVFPMLLVLTFGLVEFGRVFWRYHSAEKATAVAARFLATRGPIADLDECFVPPPTGTPAGTSCAAVAGAGAWGPETCGEGLACDDSLIAAMVGEMQVLAPFIEPDNVEVALSGTEMGFVGRGRAIPLITVRTADLEYEFIALDDLLGLGTITMPGFDATLVAEDQDEGTGS